MSLDSLKVWIALSVLPEPNFSKTRFKEFGLLRDEPKAEPVGESGAPSESDSVPLSSKSSALASFAALPIVASPGSMIHTGGL